MFHEVQLFLKMQQPLKLRPKQSEVLLSHQFDVRRSGKDRWFGAFWFELQPASKFWCGYSRRWRVADRSLIICDDPS
jgi:hypothetical protein